MAASMTSSSRISSISLVRWAGVSRPTSSSAYISSGAGGGAAAAAPIAAAVAAAGAAAGAGAGAVGGGIGGIRGVGGGGVGGVVVVVGGVWWCWWCYCWWCWWWWCLVLLVVFGGGVGHRGRVCGASACACAPGFLFCVGDYCAGQSKGCGGRLGVD